MQVYRLHDLDPQALAELCLRTPPSHPPVLDQCRRIFEQVRLRGDEAVREYSLEFDAVSPAEFRVLPEDFQQARGQVGQAVIASLTLAARNIEKFHSSQLPPESPVEVQPGIVCWRERRPIASVGLYVPSGTAVLASTVLMLGIPARLAGCPNRVLCVAPRPDGSVAPAVLVAAETAGIHQVFKMGGAQAIAALALGTGSVPKVDKILGPGNRWVQGAKLVASLEGVAIDMVAGPTEVLVIADESAPVEWVAADLISQAEHGSDSRAVLVSNSPAMIDQVRREVQKQLADLPRKKWAEAALESSFALLAGSLEEALEFANRFAPEHLILHLASPRQWVPRVRCAGSVFLGPWSPEVAGDYASGTNHTLPTSGLARAFSGVSVDSFVNKITFQELSREGLTALAPTLQTLAELEGLEGHRRAVSVRLGKYGEAPHVPHISPDLRNLVRPNILTLEPYHCAREKVQEGILLDANENPYPQDWRGVRLNRYPDPYQRELREALARYTGVSADNVLAGAGSDEVLDWIFKVFCRPGEDWVATVEPTYAMYRVTAQIFAVPVFEFLLDENFDFQADRCLKSLPPQVKIVFLCSPNNPTGNLLDRDQILRLCREGERIVVVDEAYVEFSSGESLLPEAVRHANLVVLRTLSKAFARAALRLGYAVACEEIISYFLKVKAPYNLNSLAMQQGVRALRRPGAQSRQVRSILKERDRVAARLREMPGVDKVFPSQANFILFQCRRAPAVCEQLLQRGIVVRDRSSLPGIRDCIRVTIGTPEENTLFLDALQEVAEVALYE